MTRQVISRSPAKRAAGDLLDRRHSENFAVVAAWIPRRERRLLLAVYAFARFVDEIGDAGAGDALARLDLVAGDVKRGATGLPQVPEIAGPIRALADARAPRAPMLDLIEANRMDQHVDAYATFADLLGYCRLSADPVGRLVLWVMGVEGAAPARLSDAVCSALQVVEHLQDVGEDARRGRVYLPADDLARGGVDATELYAPATSPGLRRVIALEASRAGRMLVSGSRLAGLLQGWRRLAVAGYVAGGLTAIDALEAAGWDVLGAEPWPSRPARAWSTVRMAIRGTAR